MCARVPRERITTPEESLSKMSLASMSPSPSSNTYTPLPRFRKILLHLMVGFAPVLITIPSMAAVISRVSGAHALTNSLTHSHTHSTVTNSDVHLGGKGTRTGDGPLECGFGARNEVCEGGWGWGKGSMEGGRDGGKERV